MTGDELRDEFRDGIIEHFGLGSGRTLSLNLRDSIPESEYISRFCNFVEDEMAGQTFIILTNTIYLEYNPDKSCVRATITVLIK